VVEECDLVKEFGEDYREDRRRPAGRYDHLGTPPTATNHRKRAMDAVTPLSKARRYALIGLGCACVAVGAVGVFVPGLPTTIFLLIASWAFLRSSERLHRRLHAHPRLGAYLRMARQRSMPVRARVISLLGIWGGIALAVIVGGADAPWLVAVLITAGVIGSTCVLFMRRRPAAASCSELRV
jgi:uncharacterized membrane protein YbaN (DUF454 family)